MIRILKPYISILLFCFIAYYFTVPALTQSGTDENTVQDTSAQAIDTSDYIKGDIHFNLILAADKGYDKEVLRLLNEGAYINTRTLDGVTPLMYAVEKQHTLVVKILLANGADPNLVDFDGTPALISAAKNGNFEICELLIRKSANIDQQDALRRTPLMYAVYFNDLLLTDMMLYYDAKVNITENKGNTALNIASFFGYTEIVRLLAENKATLEKPNDKLFTPLHSASQNGHVAVIDFLLIKGAALDMKTKAGYTPLALAVRNNQYEAAAMLIEHGANVNEQVAIATSTLNLAKENKNDSIAELLISNGAKMFTRPAIQYYSINFDFSFSSDDFFMGGGIGLHDTRYGLSSTLGIAARVSAKPILEESDQVNTYYQYWERRTYTYLGIYKRFKLFNLDNTSSGGLYGGGQFIYSFGSYRGASTRPDPRVLLSPAGGAYLQLKSMMITFGYEYVNFKVEKISPNRYKLGINFLIAGKGMKQPVNQTIWND